MNEIESKPVCRHCRNKRGVAQESFGVLLFLNNCTDGTSDIVASIVPRLGYAVRIVERTDDRASAGWARRRAMDAASVWLAEGDDEDGIILTTDADTPRRSRLDCS